MSLHPRLAMVRRGGRTVAYDAVAWVCDTCADPDTGEPPLAFVDAQLVAANEEALSRAWYDKYQETILPTGRPGRKTEDVRTKRIAVLLTPEEVERVDARRGEQSRSDFLRELIDEALERRSA